MHHDTPLITTIVAGLVLAFIFGTIANRFRLPPLVGYLFAGVLVGPHTPGFVADQELGAELAELGVILLMFGVGLHFSLRDLMSVRALAIPGAVAQMGFATLLGLGLGLLMGWGVGGGLVFGLALSVASTVVLLKALQDRRLIETERGRIAVGWLIVEDMAMILALVLIPAIASIGGVETGIHDPFVSFVERVFRTEIGVVGVMGLTILKVAAFVGFMLIVGRRVIPWALHATAHTGSRELFRLAVLAIALGVALGSSVLFGVSLALGAFFAGMILAESELSQRAAQETLPLRDAFAVLFFVSVGMLFDPMIVITDPLPLLATVFIIIVGKSVASFAIVMLFRRPLSTALTISASLAQIGEFSFILASMGVTLALMPSEAQDLILAGALISIILNPVVFWGVERVRPKLEQRAARKAPRPAELEEPFDGPLMPDPAKAGVDVMSEFAAAAPGAAEEAPAPLDDDDDVPQPSTKTGHTVLVGFGRVGSVVGEGLHAAGAPLVVLEDADTSISAARGMGIEVIVGNASSVDTMKLANIEQARSLLIAIPSSFEAGQVVEQGRKLNPGIHIIARAHSNEEESYLANLGADTVIMGEREIGLGMLAWVRGDRESTAAAAAQAIRMAPTSNIIDETSNPAEAANAVALNDDGTESTEAERVPPRPAGDTLPDEPIAAPPAGADTLDNTEADTVKIADKGPLAESEPAEPDAPIADEGVKPQPSDDENSDDRAIASEPAATFEPAPDADPVAIEDAGPNSEVSESSEKPEPEAEPAKDAASAETDSSSENEHGVVEDDTFDAPRVPPVKPEKRD
ncbi:sodium:proton antiporter [Devosia pacifica]|uniref:Sodium:proton antiporter n=1 Tax=Devosia pacifica TaxID=1335967 RepID=A0A918S5G2_9HYPH|nr:sodium:proton antiporter [Devosia pacifica]